MPDPKPRTDWRKDYVVCEHVAADESIEIRGRGFRACCRTCNAQGFLDAPNLEKTTEDGLCVGRLPDPAARLRELRGPMT